MSTEKENWGFLKNIWWGLTVIWGIWCLIIWTFFLFIVGLFENIFNIGRIKPVNKNQFWENVVKCLMKFHCKSFDEAMELISVHRESKNSRSLYLLEPFKVANKLAGKEVTLTHEEYKEQYLKQILGE